MRAEPRRARSRQRRRLQREDLGDGLIALVGMGALMRDLVAPAAKLGVEVVDIDKRPRGKERIAEVLNLSLVSQKCGDCLSD